jgi:homoserine dehydrogenase
LERIEGGVKARVRPQRVPRSHPLASVRGATNAITFTTDLLGDVTLIGPGAGRLETGYAILCDLLAIHRRKI